LDPDPSNPGMRMFYAVDTLQAPDQVPEPSEELPKDPKLSKEMEAISGGSKSAMNERIGAYTASLTDNERAVLRDRFGTELPARGEMESHREYGTRVHDVIEHAIKSGAAIQSEPPPGAAPQLVSDELLEARGRLTAIAEMVHEGTFANGDEMSNAVQEVLASVPEVNGPSLEAFFDEEVGRLRPQTGAELVNELLKQTPEDLYADAPEGAPTEPEPHETVGPTSIEVKHQTASGAVPAPADTRKKKAAKRTHKKKR